MRSAPFLLLLLLACRSQPRHSEPPTSIGGPEVAVQVFFGAPLTGPTQSLAASANLGQPWTAVVEVYDLAPGLPQSGSPLIDSVAMVIDPRRANPFLSSPRIFRSGRWLALEDARTWLAQQEQANNPAHHEAVALFPGQTMSLRVWPERESTPTLGLHRAQGAAMGFALTLSISEEEDPIEIMQMGQVWNADKGPLVVAIQTDKGPGVAFALKPWKPASDNAELRDTSARGLREASVPTPPPLELPDQIQPRSRFLQAALDRLRAKPDRGVLHSLSSELQAKFAQDWLLVCTEDQMREMVSDLGKGHGRQGLAGHPDLFAYRLDSLALDQAARLLMPPHFDPSALAYLVRHTGQLAKYPDVILELTQVGKSQADFVARVQAENRIFLEDSDRGARLRAFEWLRSQGLEPQGFDPLARGSQRQRALERWREELDRNDRGPAGDEQP